MYKRYVQKTNIVGCVPTILEIYRYPLSGAKWALSTTCLYEILPLLPQLSLRIQYFDWLSMFKYCPISICKTLLPKRYMATNESLVSFELERPLNACFGFPNTPKQRERVGITVRPSQFVRP